MKIITTTCCFLLLSVWSISVLSQTAYPPANFDETNAGTQANPYQIASLENLYWIAIEVFEGNSFENKFFLQTENINASETNTWFGGLGWTPIGRTTNFFAGTYNGNNKDIKNLFINVPELDAVGLFGATDGASLKNISIKDADITGRAAVGALAGLAQKTSIDHSHAIGTVSGTVVVGGLTGLAENASISSSSASGTVTGEGTTGGLTGLAENTSISNSFANVAVSGLIITGGLTGQADIASITNSHAGGNVTGEVAVGGLTGLSQLTSITGSKASGNVSGVMAVGGLTGLSQLTSITGSKASGNVSGTVAVGGLTGQADEVEIEQCYSTGNITAIDTDEDNLFLAGGLAGVIVNNSTIKNSYSTGSVFYDMDFDGNVIAGGFIGLNEAIIENCYSTGAISPMAIPKSTRTKASLGKNELVNRIAKHEKRVKELSGYDLDLSLLISRLDKTRNNEGVTIKGGFIAINDQINISNSFWDKESSGLQNGIGINNGEPSGITGKETIQMKLIGTYNDTGMEGLDTPWSIAYPPQDAVWHITSISTGFISYPFLAGNSQEPAPGLAEENRPVLNLSQQKFFDNIEDAIGEAAPGDKVVFTGTFESIDVSGSGITLSPGMSPGCATITLDFTLSSTETLEIDINGNEPCDDHDRLIVEGIANLGGATLMVSLGFGPSLGDEFVVITGNNPIAGEFAENTVTAVYGTQQFSFSVNYSGNAVTLKVTDIQSTVPVPLGSWSLLLFGLLAAVFVIAWKKPWATPNL